MKTSERFCGDVVILDLYGPLASAAVDVSLWERIRHLSRTGRRKFIVNLAHAASFNGSGISTLLGALLTAHREGSEVKLIHVRRRIDDVRVLISLYEYFEVYDSETQAVASFGPPQSPEIPAPRAVLARGVRTHVQALTPASLVLQDGKL